MRHPVLTSTVNDNTTAAAAKATINDTTDCRKTRPSVVPKTFLDSFACLLSCFVAGLGRGC